MLRAEIIAVGSELLSPWRQDTNSLFVTSELNRVGIRVWKKTIVGDRFDDLQEVFSSALARSEIVFLMGGLGPTEDDITREVVARVLGRELRLDEEALAQLERRFARISGKMTPNNRRQATVPDGAEILPNPNGTAPGLFLEDRDRLIFLLPGPPHELKPMVTDQVIAHIAARKPTTKLIYRHLRVSSEGESRVDHLVAPLYRSFAEVETTILAAAGLIDLYFYWVGEPDEARALVTLEDLTRQVKEALGASVFTEEDEALEEVVGRLLRSKRKTLATAESCTGGLIGKLVTDAAGSSDYYLGGMVTYSNDAKINWLGVDSAKIRDLGAVSPEVAQEMAVAIRRLAKADFGLSATGIAGPSGGTEEKPVGLVYIGLADDSGVETKRLRLPGTREVVRLRTARTALDWLRRKLL
jgi:nicotinamide-nucleotide amidase